MYSLNKIRNEVRKYLIKQIIESGENDMFDNKINIEKVKNCFEKENEIQNKQAESELKIDLNKSLNDIQNSELFESIINLKNKHVG